MRNANQDQQFSYLKKLVNYKEPTVSRKSNTYPGILYINISTLNVPHQFGPHCNTVANVCVRPLTSAGLPAQPLEPEHFLPPVAQDIFLTAD